MAQPEAVQPSAEALKQGYEPEGVRYGTLVGILLAVALVIAVFMGVAAWFILALNRHIGAAEVAPSDVPTVPVNTGMPPLQPSPSHNHIAAEDLVAFHQHEDELFGAIGWKTPGPDGAPRVPDNIVAAVAAKQKAAGGGGH